MSTPPDADPHNDAGPDPDARPDTDAGPGPDADPGSAVQADARPSADGPGDGDVPERPLGLSLLIWLLWFWAGAIGLVFLGFAVGDGPVMMSGRAVPRPEALRALLPVLVPMGLAVVGAALALGLRRTWARPAVLLPFVLTVLGPSLTGVGATSGGDIALAGLVLVPAIAALVWYLYFRPGPAAYFEALRTARRTRDAAP